MPSRSASKLELRREPHRSTYWLEGHELNVGDALQVWTTLGRADGIFWQGEPHLPLVGVLADSGVVEPFVMLSNSVCRRLLVQAAKQA